MQATQMPPTHPFPGADFAPPKDQLHEYDTVTHVIAICANGRWYRSFEGFDSVDDMRRNDARYRVVPRELWQRYEAMNLEIADCPVATVGLIPV
jgi:hypothetical protein